MLLGVCFCAAEAIAQHVTANSIRTCRYIVEIMMVLGYISFQCHVFIVLAKIARDALEGARLDKADVRATAAARKAVATVAFLAASA